MLLLDTESIKEDNMNCYIETLSLYARPYSQPASYRVSSDKMVPDGLDGEVSFLGYQTNEAPTKYYIWSLAQKNEIIDKMIVIVTKECMNNRFEHIGNRTTYEFYCDEIVNYLDELSKENSFIAQYINKKYNGSSKAYLSSIIVPVMVPEKMNAGEWKGIVNTIVEYGDSEDKMNLYFDFTGGSRVASLISLLMLRIIEIREAKVKQVIYGDIITDKNDPKIIDCTDSYEVLSSIENIAAANYSTEKTINKIMKELVKIGLAEEDDLKGTEELDKLSEKSSRDLSKKSEEEILNEEKKLEKSINSAKGIVKAAKKKSVDETKKNNRMSPFRKLKEKRPKDKDLIKDFHEEIIGVFFDLNIILCQKNGNDRRDPKILIQNALKANEDYYHKTDKKGKETGVIPSVKSWIRVLQDNDFFWPGKTYKRNCNIQLPFYSKDRTVNGWRVKGVTKQHAIFFDEYLDNVGINKNEVSFLDLCTLQRIYFNYGFPFMCMDCGLGTDMHPEIMEYYNEVVFEFMKELDELKKRDFKKYKDELDMLLREESSIEKAIPYLVKLDFYETNQCKFPDEEKAKEFIQTLCSRIEKVRLFRNAIAHNSHNEYSNPEKQHEIADEIRKWLDEYETVFIETKE